MPARSAARLIPLLLVLAGVLAPPAHAQYQVPPDNPFVNVAGARGEIYVYGMRNPYRWSFDRLTGDMWIGDVGGIQEEVDHLPRARIAGANLGWNCLSGTAVQTGCTPANYIAPVHTYPSGPDVVIGGYVVRDPSLPAFAGRYLFGRLNSGIYRLEANGGATHLLDVPGVSGFGEDGTGHLYVTSLSGPVYRLGQNGSNLTTTSIGNFSQPLGVAAAPGDTERLFIVEKTGKVRVRTGGQVSDFLDISSLIARTAASRACSRSPSRPTTRPAGACSSSTRTSGNDLQLDEFRRTADGPTAPTCPRAARAHDPARPGPKPQRRPAPVRARRAALPVDRRRRHPGRPGGRRSEPRARCSARCCGIDVGVRAAAGDTTAPRLRTKVQAAPARAAPARRGRLRALQRELRRDRGRTAADRGPRVPAQARRQDRRGQQAHAAEGPHSAAPARSALAARARERHRQVAMRLSVRARDAAGNRSALAAQGRLRQALSSPGAARGSARSTGLVVSSSARP